MIIEQTATGKTVEEAKENALNMMGITPDSDIEYDFEIVDLPQKKKFGIFGGSPAKVRVFREVKEENKPKAEKKSEKVEKKAEEKAKAATKTEIKEQAKPAEHEEKKHKPVGSLTEDEIKNVVDYLEKVLTLMGVKDFTTSITNLEDGIMININGSKIGVAIGRKGETIDALQHLVSLVANKGKDDYFRVTLNPGEYREKRESVLIGVAKKSAEKALKFKRNIVLEPVNSYERRIIHNAVQEIEGVESWSVGEGDHRRVVIGNKDFANSSRNDRKGGYNRNGRGRQQRTSRPNYKIDAQPTREPIKDSDGPLYGVVKHDEN